MVEEPSDTITTGQSLPLENDHFRARTSSLGFLQHKLHRLSFHSSRSSSRSDQTVQTSLDIKGPLGLNLLHEPSEPRIDFIFVHGLGGGSRKTWSFSPEPGMFWPKEWLPNEVGFKHVRLHSYGYNSDWTSRKESQLTFHDFGQALLADLHNSPYLRKNGDTPIVLVAHSMGGLVAKKAYLLATRDPTYQAIARRVHTMYFLGTPHRGADSVNLAKLICQSAGYGSKAFLDDLVPGCGTLDQINDEFRHVCGNIHIWSFTESIKTNFGIMSSLVVDRTSAILGLPKERVQYINADHRHICKFDNPLNPNYTILQRAFLTTIEDMGVNISFQQGPQYRSQMKKVASLLRVDQRPEATLAAINEKQHSGSCQWLTEDRTFEDWVDNPVDYWEETDPLQQPPENSPPRMLWLNGRPGTGKSVAAGHVIRYLQSCNLDCSFYFFEHKDKASSTVAAFLRSLAFQMAESSFDVRRALVSMADEDIRLNHDDHHTLWTSLFVEQILKVEHTRPQFWVLDAIDECSSKGVPALVSMLSSLDCKTNVRVFMTSRPGGQLERLLTLEQTKFSEITTGHEGSLRDIELLVKARCPQASDGGPYQELVTDVLAKCNGIFLWASLTVARMEDVYSIEGKQDVLRQIPPEMDMFYSRIIASVVESPNAELAKCILKWIICSPKPLHIEELAEAVKLDIGPTLTASAGQLETMTGHLVFVDNQSRVHITHQTTSAFLTQRRDGFWIDRAAAHSRLAEVCLTILCGSDFAPPRMRRGAATTGATALLPLSNYATLNFSYHLMHSSSAADAPLILLNKFFRSNVLTWIERTASSGNLWTLQLTAQRLKAYLGRRAKYQSPISVEIQTVSAWAVDIYHIVAAFHSSLLTSPSSIHFLIPQFCPPKSSIWQFFAKPTKRLRIVGPMEEDWNDRLACYLFPEEACAIACCARLLAVGLANGDIRLYHVAGSGTFEPAATLSHGKKVRQLAFNRSSSLLASCSVRKLMLWNVHASTGPSFPCLWSQNIDFTPCYMTFHPDATQIMLAHPEDSAIVAFAASDGRREEPVLLHAWSDSDSDFSDESDQQLAPWTPYERIRLDPSHKLAVLAYRNASVTVWDLEAGEKIGNFEKEGQENVYSTPATLDMVFNPISELELLAVTYKDGDIVTCNPWTLEQTNKYHLQVALGALAATSDGRVLAGTAWDGAIYLFLFETLQPLYQIGRPDDQVQIRDIAFSADNLRFFDIRGQSCNVWEPLVLVPRDVSDDSSSEHYSEEIVLPELPASSGHVFRLGESITSIEQAARGNYLLVGRNDGSIDLCELGTGDVLEKLRLHNAFAEIEHMDWNDEQSSLLSVDTHGRCIVTRFSPIGKGTKSQTNCLLYYRERGAVKQALISPKADSILVRTNSSVKIIRLDASLVGEDTSVPESWWMRHPTESSHLIAIQGNTLHLFEWCSLKRVLSTDGVTLLIPPGLPMREASHPWVGGAGSSYLAQAFVRSHTRVSDLVALDMSKITTESKELPLLMLHADSLNVQSVLGCLRSSLFFLDTSGWLCSISLKNLTKATYFTRHFFIPLTWRTGARTMIKIVSKTAVAFGRGEQLFVFHGFLEFEEKVAL